MSKERVSRRRFVRQTATGTVLAFGVGLLPNRSFAADSGGTVTVSVKGNSKGEGEVTVSYSRKVGW
jgi:hypothetical protein